MIVRRVKAVLQIWWVGLFLLAGIALAAWIVASARDKIAFALHSVAVEGRIVDVRSETRTERRNGRNETSTYYSTTVEYEDASGTTHSFVPDVVSGVPQIGPIAVRYHNEHPEDARVEGFMETWLTTLFWIPFALVMVIGAVLMLRETWNDAVPEPGTPPVAKPFVEKRSDGPPRQDPIGAIRHARRAHAAELASTPAQRAQIHAVLREAIDSDAHDYADLVLAHPQRERIVKLQVEIAMEAYSCGLMARRGWIEPLVAQQGAMYLGRKLRDELRALGVDLGKVNANFGTVIDRALLNIVEREFA